MNKKTVVLGASANPSRYSHLAVHKLKQYGHDVVAVGLRDGAIDGVVIQHGMPTVTDVDTVTMYMNETRQKEFYDYIIDMKPKRIIFNPGAENEELTALAKKNGIEPLEACTLVMLSTGQY